MQDTNTVISKLKSNQHIPKLLVEYYINCILKEKENQLTKALQDNMEATVNAIGKMFYTAEGYTGYDANYILEMTGLSANDFDEARIDSAFAEVRAINHLGDIGVTDFMLVHDKHKRQSDIVAFHKNRKYCIEVTTIAVSGRQKWTQNELITTIYNKFIDEGKGQQLSNTLLNEECNKMLFMVVILKEKAIALNDRNEYLNVLKETYEIINNESLHIGILTGMKTLGVGADECIWPAL